MSWSIYLSGPKEAVISEMEDAIGILQEAIGAADRLPDDGQVNAAISGYASSTGETIIGSSANYTVSYTPPPEPAKESAAVPMDDPHHHPIEMDTFSI